MFHIDKEKGTMGSCSAQTPASCPYGGAESKETHFETFAEAKERLAGALKNEHGQFKTVSRPENASVNVKDSKDNSSTDSESKSSGSKKSNGNSKPEKYDPVRDGGEPESIRDMFATRRTMKKNRENRERYDSKYKGSDEWFDDMLAEREIMLDARIARLEHAETIGDVGQKQKYLDYINEPFRPDWRKKKNNDGNVIPYVFHPEINNEKTMKEASETIMAFTGMSSEELNKKLREAMDAGLDRTEGYRKVWADAELRSDKNIVVIDLETAGPTTYIDMGPTSQIIEVGYIVRKPDGTMEQKSYLSGISDKQRAAYGTGAEHVHNISVDMVDGKTEFLKDEERQQELLDDLKGSVMVAHNALYEISQLTHNLRGFHNAMRDGEIEVLDTRNVAKYFVPDSPSNSNEDFVKTTGGVYEGAHRAYEDAVMSWNALNRLKNIGEDIG